MKKKKLILTIILLFATVLAVTFVFVILPQLPATRHRYKDYKTFRQKAKAGFFTEIMPASAEPEFYYHSAHFSRQAGYRVKLADDEYSRLKKEADERYHSYKNEWENIGSLNIGSPDKTALTDHSKLKDEGIGFLNDELMHSNEEFYLLYDFRFDDNTVAYRVGMMCNDNTNEIIEFYVRTAEAD